MVCSLHIFRLRCYRCLHLELNVIPLCRLRLKCDGTRAETRFFLSAKRTSPFKSAGASIQSTTGSRGMRISGSSKVVKATGYPPHSPVSPSLSLPCVTVCHHVSTGLYFLPAILTVFVFSSNTNWKFISYVHNFHLKTLLSYILIRL
jgi:hypothetical protein